MSIRVMTRIWEHASYKESTLLVLLALADYADDHGICWPDIPSLAAKARVSDRRAIDIIKALEEDGAILFERGGGRGKRSRYAILVGLTEEQKEKVKEFHRNYFSENKTVKSAVIKGELQRKKRVNYSVNSHLDSVQQDAPNPDPIRHHDPSMNPSPPPAADRAIKNGGGEGDVSNDMEAMLYEYGIKAAPQIAALYQQKHPAVDVATVRQSIENIYDAKDPYTLNTIVRRLQRTPPEPGKPWPPIRKPTPAHTNNAPLAATKPNIPVDVLTPAQLAERAKAKLANR